MSLFWVIITCYLLTLAPTNGNKFNTISSSGCSTYLHSDRLQRSNGEWVARLDVGTLQRQVVGFDVALTFLFRNGTMRVSNLVGPVAAHHLSPYNCLLIFHALSLGFGLGLDLAAIWIHRIMVDPSSILSWMAIRIT